MDPTQHAQIMSRAIVQIELFLLPKSDLKSQQPVSVVGKFDTNATPILRLEQTLFQVALADHIRAFQTMYRDVHDAQCLVSDLRQENAAVKLPMKHILDKIVEGRSRSIALIKMCHGDQSLEMLRGLLDLASSYALQGMWPQVDGILHKTTVIIDFLSLEYNFQAHNSKWSKSYNAALRISCVYRLLRAHAVRSGGKVHKSFVKELLAGLGELVVHEDQSDNAHPSALAAAVYTFLTTRTAPKDRQQLKVLSQSYFAEKTQQVSEEVAPKSWGEVVDFLRRHCVPMSVWVRAMEDALLPQNKAALMLPFRQCDMQQRHVAHPVQLSQTLMRFPATAKLLAGTNLVKQLVQLKAEVPLAVDLSSGSLVDLHSSGKGGGHFFGSQHQSVIYELPLAVDEYLSNFVLQTEEPAGDHLNIYRVHALTLQGICAIYTAEGTGSIPASAEDALVQALNLLEQSGLEMTVVACELYNSIAQLMIMKHRQWMANRQVRIKAELEVWLGGDEGRLEIRKQVKAIKKQHAHKSLLMSGGEVEVRAKNHVTKKRLQYLQSVQEDQAEMNKTLEAAYRYLVRSFEILEETHGPSHPAVGTACLAVASVQNILEQYEDTREWLVRALRFMEKYNPVPVRAVTFTQTQLSQVLLKLGHDDEARRVLAKAAEFHMQQAQEELQLHLNEKIGDPADSASNSIPSPILKGTPLFDAVEVALDLTGRAMRMSAKSGDKWPAAQLAEELAALTESAFGWDSAQSADAFKQVGIRCAAVADWTRAIKFLKQSAESHEVLFGKEDSRTKSVHKLLQSVRKSKSGNGQAIDPPLDAKDSPQQDNDTSGFPLDERPDSPAVLHPESETETADILDQLLQPSTERLYPLNVTDPSQLAELNGLNSH